ncbi:MAG: MBL fold metallo-hydrolase [Phycisphaerae bacterium]
MLTFSLQTGSNGNAVYVEADGKRLLFDAGISGRQAKLRMAAHGRCMHQLDALIISHDHSDHVKHAGVFQRLFRVPIYCTEPTFQACRWRIGKVSHVNHFVAGQTLEFGPTVRVHTISTPHDAVDGVCFVVESSAGRLGIFSDLGHPFLQLRAALESVDAAYLESNYDPQMLADGPYPQATKDRIRGDGGHISNHEAAGLLAGLGKRLQWAALVHLSNDNNHPDVALKTHRDLLGDDYPLLISTRYAVTDLLHCAREAERVVH